MVLVLTRYLLNFFLHEARRRRNSLFVVSIDVSKAFDSITHYSIVRALRAAGIEEKMVDYVKNSYLGSSTIISCAGLKTDRVHVTNGVKQGDPLSPILFNAVLDELLRDLPPGSEFPSGK